MRMKPLLPSGLRQPWRRSMKISRREEASCWQGSADFMSSQRDARGHLNSIRDRSWRLCLVGSPLTKASCRPLRVLSIPCYFSLLYAELYLSSWALKHNMETRNCLTFYRIPSKTYRIDKKLSNLLTFFNNWYTVVLPCLTNSRLIFKTIKNY